MKILAVSGASGGHIFPVLAFLDTLKQKRKEVETLLVLPRTSIKEQIENLDYNVEYISISSVKLSLDFRNIPAIFRFLKGFAESLAMLLRFRPNVVIGFGSITSIPMILLAKFLGIKTLIHEQNVIPGRANKLLARFCDSIAVSFSETLAYFKDYQGKTVLTGNPIRNELKRLGKKEALDFFGLKQNKFTILVMGGSLGSHNINIAFLKSIPKISHKTNFQIIHLSGAKDYEVLKDSYRDLNSKVRLYSFLKAMQYAYSACDIVISRAGATTISEIMNFQIPAIIIPYPYAYQHQLDNAKVLERIGSAIVIEDQELDTDILSETLNKLINDPAKLNSMRSCYNNRPLSNANCLLVDQALSLYNK